jgi:hypothetical protein
MGDTLQNLINRLDNMACYSEWKGEADTAEEASEELTRLAEENERLRAALYEISQLTPGLWKHIDNYLLAVFDKFNEAKRIAWQALQKDEPMV